MARGQGDKLPAHGCRPRLAPWTLARSGSPNFDDFLIQLAPRPMVISQA